ncbi:MAG: AAA family ATPase [Actinomycetota bacterium]|nr:AAA family ATPase [Actinomycetota bacterium]
MTSDRIDAWRFEYLVAHARREFADGNAGAAAASLGEALLLWRGPALADFADEPFASLEAARLNELRVAALEEQAEAELALGRHDQLVPRLRALVDQHPLRERLWGQLLVALYRCGRQAEALRAYQTARRTLAEDLGIEPGPTLRRLEGDILAQSPSLDWRPPAPAADAARSLVGVPFPTLLALHRKVDYVGRDELVAHLETARHQASNGTCRAILLGGEPGIGKTRTAAEVARVAFEAGAVVLYGRCQEAPGLPYQPFAEALDWYTCHAAEPVLGRHPGELTRLQPLLTSRIDGLPAPVSSDPRSEEYLLFESTSSWLIELSSQRPVVLVVDDLHWASKPVLLLLHHVVRTAAAAEQGARILILGTYRTSEIDRGHPLLDIIAELRRLAAMEQLGIVGLSRAEAKTFVSRALDDDPDDVDEELRALVTTLHAETEGNPFFLDEVLRHLLETGVLHRVGGRWLVSALRGTVVPQGVRDVIGPRLGRLSSPAVQLLSTASVVGRDFDVELLAALSDLPEDDLLDALDEAMAARLIEETGADRYRFTHALVQATLSGQLSATRRGRLHRRVAEALEKLRSDDAVSLAYHLIESGPANDDVGRAAGYALAAAERALQARALAEADVRFRQVLELLDRMPDLGDSKRIEALCGLGEAQRDQGDCEFRATLLEAARFAHEVGDVGLLVRAALSNSRGLPSIIGGIDKERVAVTEAALAAVGEKPTAERARLLAQLAAEVTFTRDDRRRLALADEAEKIARGMGDGALLAEVLNRTGYAAYSPRRIERLVARAEEATRLADASADPAQRVLGRYFLAGSLLSAGDIPRFRRVTAEMVEVSRDAAPTLQWLAKACRPRLAVLDGCVEEAGRLNDEAFAFAQELNEADGAAWWMATLAIGTWCRGGFGAMTDSLRAGMDVYPDEPAWSIGYAMALAMDGRLAEARAAVDADPPDPDALVDHVFPFLNVFMTGVIAFHLDDGDLAARTAAAIRPFGACWVHHYAGSSGPLAVGLALCAAATGDLDESIRWFDRADRALIDFGCCGALPQVRAYHAEVLIRRSTEDDAHRAAELLQWIKRDAVEFAAPSLLARAEQLAASLRTQPLRHGRPRGPAEPASG